MSDIADRARQAYESRKAERRRRREERRQRAYEDERDELLHRAHRILDADEDGWIDHDQDRDKPVFRLSVREGGAHQLELRPVDEEGASLVAVRPCRDGGCFGRLVSAPITSLADLGAFLAGAGPRYHEGDDELGTRWAGDAVAWEVRWNDGFRTLFKDDPHVRELEARRYPLTYADPAARPDA